LLPDVETIRRTLATGGAHAAEVAETALGVVVRAQASVVIDALAALSAEGYESLVDLDGIDTGSAIELTYRVRSYAHALEVFVKTTVPYGAQVASVWNLYPAALMPEREAAELLGMTLSGHPNPKRLLTTDGVAPLLRKDVAIRTVEEVRRS